MPGLRGGDRARARGERRAVREVEGEMKRGEMKRED